MGWNGAWVDATVHPSLETPMFAAFNTIPVTTLDTTAKTAIEATTGATLIATTKTPYNRS